VSGSAPAAGSKLAAKTRYRQADAPCIVAAVDPAAMELEFTSDQWAVTPGQSAVLYDGEVCLGGGVIERAYAGAVSANEARSESLA
jgi:tRNA-uridine 2-sulfurtransferase